MASVAAIREGMKMFNSYGGKEVILLATPQGTLKSDLSVKDASGNMNVYISNTRRLMKRFRFKLNVGNLMCESHSNQGTAVRLCFWLAFI